MPLFRSILLAADFSENSREAFRMACSLAQEGETRVLVLHVEEPLYVAEEPVYFNQPSVHYTAVERPETELSPLNERLRQDYVPDLAVETIYHTVEGGPAEMILREAEVNRCDLIVVGTHGRTGLTRLLSGSVAEAVLRGAKCPVLALRAHPPGKSIDGNIQCILAPTDDSEASHHAVRIARALACRLGARLILLRVAPLEIVAGTEVMLPIDVQACRESLDAMRRQLDGPDLKFPVETMLRQGHVESEILDAIKGLPGVMVVMGTYGRSGLARLLVGSVAEGVLRHAECPVLTVKPSVSGEPGVLGAETSRTQAAAGHIDR
jgi:nucleotide-binding universal stress UspA family protein